MSERRSTPDQTWYYAGIDTCAYSGIIPTSTYSYLAKTLPCTPNKPWSILIHDPGQGYTLSAGHKTDSPSKIERQGGHSAYVTVHSWGCYSHAISWPATAYDIRQTRLRRLDICIDTPRPLPDYRNTYLRRYGPPMVVPGQSLTYGWGTKYKRLCVTWYDKRADIQAAGGAKDYFLHHYPPAESAPTITRLEIRILREAWRQHPVDYPCTAAAYSSRDIRDVVMSEADKIHSRDPAWSDLPILLQSALVAILDGPTSEALGRPDHTLTIAQLEATLIGTALAYARLRADTAAQLSAATTPDDIMGAVIMACAEAARGSVARARFERDLQTNPAQPPVYNKGGSTLSRSRPPYTADHAQT